jgi:sialate O-acetylesterase
VTIKGSDDVVLKNVMVGEVWFCSGQSNMQMPVKGFLNQPVEGSHEAILQSSKNKIHFFNADRVASLTPQFDTKGNWQVADPATTGDCSATAYFFAKKLQEVLGIPVGLIHSSWGASAIEAWMDPASLAGFSNKKFPEKVPEKTPQIYPALLYNGMLHPFIGYGIKGFIWYQGEANRSNANEYQQLLTSLIGSWRNKWQHENLPFYYVQIAPFDYKDVNAAFVREAQLKTTLSVQSTGMVVTLDLGEKNNIHPSKKEMVGKRLANWALAKTYNLKGIAYTGPVYKQIQITEKGRAIIEFEFAPLGLTSFGNPLIGFEIAGEDRVFYPASATINNDKAGFITVWSDEVSKPVSVRYAFKSWAEGNLYNTQGIPASPFRTDDW